MIAFMFVRERERKRSGVEGGGEREKETMTEIIKESKRKITRTFWLNLKRFDEHTQNKNDNKKRENKNENCFIRCILKQSNVGLHAEEAIKYVRTKYTPGGGNKTNTQN